MILISMFSMQQRIKVSVHTFRNMKTLFISSIWSGLFTIFVNSFSIYMSKQSLTDYIYLMYHILIENLGRKSIFLLVGKFPYRNF